MGVMSRANSLAMYELLGDADLMNTEFSKYQEVTVEDIQLYAQQIFDENNCSTMHYLSNK